MIALLIPAERTSEVDWEISQPFAEKARSYIFLRKLLSRMLGVRCV